MTQSEQIPSAPQSEPTAPPAEGAPQVPAAPALPPGPPAPIFARPVIKRRVRRPEMEKKEGEGTKEADPGPVPAAPPPDEFQEVGTTIVDWIVQHSRPIGTAFGIILVGLVIGGVMQSQRTDARDSAAGALFAAMTERPDLSATDALLTDDAKKKAADTIQKLDAVAAEHGGTPQADQARVEAAALAASLGEFDKALVYLDQAKERKGVIGEAARTARASVLESLSRLDDTVVALEELRTTALGAAKEQATVDLARVYEAKGDKAKAKALYDQFSTEFPDSLLLPDVQSRSAALGAP